MSDVDDLLTAVEEAPEGDSEIFNQQLLFNTPSTSKGIKSVKPKSSTASTSKRSNTSKSVSKSRKAAQGSKRKLIVESDSESEESESEAEGEGEGDPALDKLTLSGFDPSTFINSLATSIEDKYGRRNSDEEEIDLDTFEVVRKNKKGPPKTMKSPPKARSSTSSSKVAKVVKKSAKAVSSTLKQNGSGSKKHRQAIESSDDSDHSAMAKQSSKQSNAKRSQHQNVSSRKSSDNLNGKQPKPSLSPEKSASAAGHLPQHISFHPDPYHHDARNTDQQFAPYQHQPSHRPGYYPPPPTHYDPYYGQYDYRQHYEPYPPPQPYYGSNYYPPPPPPNMHHYPAQPYQYDAGYNRGQVTRAQVNNQPTQQQLIASNSKGGQTTSRSFTVTRHDVLNVLPDGALSRAPAAASSSNGSCNIVALPNSAQSFNHNIKQSIGLVLKRSAMNNLEYQKKELNDMLNQLFEGQNDMKDLLTEIVKRSMKVSRLAPLSPNYTPIFRFDNEQVPHFELFLQHSRSSLQADDRINNINSEIVKLSRMIYELLVDSQDGMQFFPS